MSNFWVHPDTGFHFVDQIPFMTDISFCWKEAAFWAGKRLLVHIRKLSGILQAGVAINEALNDARRARKKPRLLRSQAVLAEAHATKPAIPHQLRRQKGRPRRHSQQPARPSMTGIKSAATSSMYDLWEEPEVEAAPQGQLALPDNLNLDKHSSGVNRRGVQISLLSGVATIPAVLQCGLKAAGYPAL